MNEIQSHCNCTVTTKISISIGKYKGLVHAGGTWGGGGDGGRGLVHVGWKHGGMVSVGVVCMEGGWSCIRYMQLYSYYKNQHFDWEVQYPTIWALTVHSLSAAASSVAAAVVSFWILQSARYFPLTPSISSDTAQ